MTVEKLFPRTLIVSDAPMTPQQGTGVCLLKHFEPYLEDRVYSVYMDDPGGSSTIRHSSKFELVEPLAKLWRLLRPINPSLRANVRFKLLDSQWRQQARAILNEFKPEFIYIVPYTESALYLAQVIRELVPGIPYGLHLFDWMPRTSEKVARSLLATLSEDASFRWALGSNLADGASAWTGANYKVVPIFYGNPAQELAHEAWHRQSTFNACILGNVWSKPALIQVLETWRILKTQNSDLGPIEWIASEWTIRMGWREFLSDPKYKDLIKHVGFIPDSDFHARLMTYQLSFIPFSMPSESTRPYAKFSIPSKISELSCLGIPFFSVASEGSGLERFMAETGIGFVAPVDVSEFAKEVGDLMHDKTRLRECSDELLQYAKANFQMEDYQNFLWETLAEASIC